MEITGPLIRSSFVRLLTRTTNGLEICYLFITRLGLVLSTLHQSIVAWR